MLSRREIASFVEDGFVAVRGAVPRSTAAHCRRSIDARLRARGVDPTDPATWKPVVAVPWPDTASFAAMVEAPALTEAYDQLLGRGTWTHVPLMGGVVHVRFPTRRRDRNAIWHVDGSFVRDGVPATSLENPLRGALTLILLSDTGERDAPTQLKVGSHLDVPDLLAPFGPEGRSFLDVTASLQPTTLERPTELMTGRAGDVFLCHPFLVHRPTARHRGAAPRYLAQPGVLAHRPFRVEGSRPRPIERAIRRGLDAPAGDRRLLAS